MRRTAYWAIGVVAAAAIVIPFTGCGNKTVAGIPATVATVNGKQISSDDYIKYTSIQAGRRVLSSLIEEQLVMQWADELKVAPTPEQINNQIALFKREGIYDEQAKQLGEEYVKNEIKAMQAKVNIAKTFSQITDADLQQAYNQSKDRYVHGARKQVAMIVNPDKAKVDEALKMVTKGDDFDKVAASQSDPRFLMRGAAFKTWVEDNQPGLPPAISAAAKETKVGGVSTVFTIGQPGQPSQYAILKVVVDMPASNKAMQDVKSELQDSVAWQKSMEPTFVEKLNERKKKANIQVDMTQFSDIVNEFKNPPAPMPMMAPPQQPSSAPAPSKSAKPSKPVK